MSSELMNRWFDEVWNKENEDAIDLMLAHDCIIHGLTDLDRQPVKARPAFKAFHKELRSQFLTLTITVQSSTANADGTTTSECLVTGTHKASDKRVTFNGTAQIRVNDSGQICEVWNRFDLDEIRKQTT